MMTSLCVLPCSVIADLLSSWLCIRDVGRLDAAVCLASLQPWMDDSLHSSTLRHTKNDPPVCINFASWLIKRKIQLRELFVGKGFEGLTKLLECQLFQSAGSTVRKITIGASYNYQCTNDTLLNVCLHATCLEVCIVEPVVSEEVVGVLLAMHPRIRVLNLNGDDLLRRAGRQKSCAHLTDLTICGSVSTESLHTFLDINLPVLQKLSLPGCDAFKEGELTKLRKLRQLHTLSMGQLDLYISPGCSLPDIKELEVKLSCARFGMSRLSYTAKMFPNVRILAINRCNVPQSTSMLLELLSLLPQLRQYTLWNEPEAKQMPVRTTIPRIYPACGNITTTIGTQYPLEKLHIFLERGNFDLAQIMAVCPALYDVGLTYLPLNIGTAIQSNRGSVLRLCTYCTEGTAENAAVVCGLQELVLVDGSKLTDILLNKLAKNNPQLRVLFIKNLSSNISYRGLQAFLENCPELTSVTFMVHKPNSSKTYCDADVMVNTWCRRLYPNIKHFECNIV